MWGLRRQTLNLVGKALPGLAGDSSDDANLRLREDRIGARALATVPLPPPTAHASPRRDPRPLLAGGARAGLGGGHDVGIRRFQTAPARLATRGGGESSVGRLQQLLRPAQEAAHVGGGRVGAQHSQREAPPPLPGRGLGLGLEGPSEPSGVDGSRGQLALLDGAGGGGRGQLGVRRFRREELPPPPVGLVPAGGQIGVQRFRRHELPPPPPGIIVRRDASNFGVNRLTREQIRARLAEKSVERVAPPPDPQFDSTASDWELHDEEDADPASASRATARASRRGNALAPLPGASSRRNRKRRCRDGVATDGSSTGSASDSTLADQPRKRARKAMLFPALSAKCNPVAGIEYCVGQQPQYNEGDSHPLCRLAGCRETRCKKLGQGPAKDFFCNGHYNEVTGKENRVDLQGGGFPALALSKVPPGVDACVGKPPKTKKVGKGKREISLCRLAGCKETKCTKLSNGTRNDHFCAEHFREHALDQSQWEGKREKPWDGTAFPELVHTAVPAGVDANVGKTPRREDGVLLCRLAAFERSNCTVPGDWRRSEYFCRGCHTRYLRANQEYAEEMDQLHARKVRDGDTIDTTLRQHLLDQSFDAATDGDADVHLAQNKLLFHFTAASSLEHWERNNASEIQLKPNGQLKRATLNEHTPHWHKMSRKKREDSDNKVWATTSFLGGWRFIAGHHKCPPKKGTVWHVLVIASDNSAYKTFSQHRLWDKEGYPIGENHECMVQSVGRDVVPNLVLRVEFRDSNIKNAKMTVVRVNGDAATEVEIDAEDPRFKITDEKISWRGD